MGGGGIYSYRVYIKKKKKISIKSLGLHVKELEKEQIKLKASKKKEIINIRVQIKESIKSKVGFFKRSTKLTKKFTKKKRENQKQK